MKDDKSDEPREGEFLGSAKTESEGVVKTSYLYEVDPELEMLTFRGESPGGMTLVNVSYAQVRYAAWVIRDDKE